MAFSKTWLKKFYALGEPLLTAAGKTYGPIEPDNGGLMTSTIPGAIAEGVPYNRAAQMKEPAPATAQASFFHHLLIQAGATFAKAPGIAIMAKAHPGRTGCGPVT